MSFKQLESRLQKIENTANLEPDAEYQTERKRLIREYFESNQETLSQLVQELSEFAEPYYELRDGNPWFTGSKKQIAEFETKHDELLNVLMMKFFPDLMKSLNELADEHGVKK